MDGTFWRLWLYDASVSVINISSWQRVGNCRTADGRMEGRSDERTYGWTDDRAVMAVGRTDVQTRGQTDDLLAFSGIVISRKQIQ